MGKNNCDVGKLDLKLCGTVTIGPKGQIVIPKEIREKLDLKAGDSISVLLESEKFIGLVRNNDLSDLMEYMKIDK